MIDIVCFNGEKFDLGFSKVYSCNEFNIAYGKEDNRKLLENKRLDILVSPSTILAMFFPKTFFIFLIL